MDALSGVTLKEYFEGRLILLEQLLDQRLEAFEKQWNLEREALGHRLEGMNEIRGSLQDQAEASKQALQDLLSKLFSRDEHNAFQKMIQTQFETLAATTVQTKEQLRGEQATYRQVVDKELESLKLSRAELAGKASQSQVNRSTLIAIISLVMTFVAWATRFYK